MQRQIYWFVMSWHCYFIFVQFWSGIYIEMLLFAGVYKLSWWKHIFGACNLWLHVLGKMKFMSPQPPNRPIRTQRFLIQTHCPLASYFNSLLLTNISVLKKFGDPICFQIKPKVGTVCFGVAASQGAILLAGGEKGMRYAMPNARIMMNQPQCGFGVRIKLLKICRKRQLQILEADKSWNGKIHSELGRKRIIIPTIRVMWSNAPFSLWVMWSNAHYVPSSFLSTNFYKIRGHGFSDLRLDLTCQIAC